MMIRYLYFLTIAFLVSCGQEHIISKKNEAVIKDSVGTPAKSTTLTDKTVKFLWREDRYDPELKDTFNTIVINEELSKTLTEPEIAALGYVGTYIGSECQWDENDNNDRSNLKCKVLSALNLGYQCSDKHLGFLKRWFKNDKKVLEELNNNCPIIPFTASSQETFSEIILTVNGDSIAVWFTATGVNMPMGESWRYSETDYFKLDNDNIRLIGKKQSEIERDHFDTGEE
jgi:hypothetical protein